MGADDWFFLGLFAGLFAGVAIPSIYVWKSGWLPWRRSTSSTRVSILIRNHVYPIPLADLAISERQFPKRMRADLQRAVDVLLEDGATQVCAFRALQSDEWRDNLGIAECVIESFSDPVKCIPPKYEDVDIGEETPVRVLKLGLWLLERDGLRFVLLKTHTSRYGELTAVSVQLGMPNTEQGHALAQQLFRRIELAVQTGVSYRGKILSLDVPENSYSGQSTGITVHKLRTVERDQVILPAKTLELLERNVLRFVTRRGDLTKLGLATKKGLLFYGPPGTGKTHTIHYLAKALEGHTTLLISAEQMGLLGEYMTLARLLQPSLVVLEDVDLIARDRSQMRSGCEESLLNKLLNEMDGLKPAADILFLLTTNRPEALEAALSARPGRIDQAIEFPAPDEEGRLKLVRLYGGGLAMSPELDAEIVRRTEGVSAAFIKELMRRIAQFRLERETATTCERIDLDRALDEMLFTGGSLNAKLLGAGSAGAEDKSAQ